MKKLLLLLLPLLIFSACDKKSKTDEAISYNDTLVNSFDPITQKMVEFEMALYDSKSTDIDRMYDDLSTSIDRTVKFISEKPAFDGNESFKNAALDIVKFYDSVIDNEYKQMLEMIKSDTLSAEDEQRLGAAIDSTYSKEAQYYNAFEKEQAAFAAKYKFNVNKKAKE